MDTSLFDSYLKKFGRYPDPIDTEELILGNFPKGARSTSTLKAILNQTLFIDVTHTVHYTFNSGIQRVVRTLVTAMKNNGASFELIKFDLDGQPILLTPHEVDKFYNWDKHIHSASTARLNALDSTARAIGPIIRGLVPNSVWNFAKKFYFRFKARLSAQSSVLSSSTSIEVLDLRNKKLLLPEVVTETERINAVTVLSKYYNVSVSTVLYDLIPITHPEYCTVGYDFVHYLRIFRSIDKVFSISKHSENELNRIMNIVPREVKSPLKLETIYLGGDFDFVKNAPVVPVSEKKTILMVARFEPRKNIRRVLVAIKKLFEESQNFKFVLVGNPGWLQENIIADLDMLKAKGYDIEYHMRIPDAELIAWYQKAHFTVFCSITEGFGLPIIESVLMGKPCITTNNGSQAEVGNLIGGCDLVDPFDANDIYDKIKRMLTDESHYQTKVLQTKSAKWPSWADYAKQVQASLDTKSI